MTKNLICQECGETVDTDARFCAHCGTPRGKTGAEAAGADAWDGPDPDFDTKWRVEIAAPRGKKLRSLLKLSQERFGHDISPTDHGSKYVYYVDDLETALTVAEWCEATTSELGLPADVSVLKWSASREAWVEPEVLEPRDFTDDGRTLASSASVLVATTFEIPGFETVAFHGEVFGLVVRSRNVISSIGASAKAAIGGELHGLTRLLNDGRQAALDRMRQAALERGANAVVGLRYDSGELAGSANEVVAYGTAVTVRARNPA